MIEFGTEGWRGVLGKDFTFRNVRLVTQAIVDYVQQADDDRPALIGYDTRYLSEKFSREAARVLSHNGIRALRCNRDTPTPALSLAVRERGACGALNFTASHNPAPYYGLEFTDDRGAPAIPGVTASIEAKLRDLEPRFEDVYFADPSLIEDIDPSEAYRDHVIGLVDPSIIAAADLYVTVDSLYGTGRDYLDRLLLDAGARVQVLHNFREPYYSGYSPAAGRETLGELEALIRDTGSDLGLATDNDCDRFAAVDRGGVWIDANDLVALLADYVLSERGLHGDIGRSVSTTHRIDRIAERHGVAVHETPVGFKYLAELLYRDEIVFGGEESAGVSIQGHTPGKDGILASLLIAEMTARRGKTLREQIADLERAYGPHVHVRHDVPLTPEIAQRVQEVGEDVPDTFAERPVRDVTRVDGVKILLDDSWYLFRTSGTEAIIRCYAEVSSPTEVQRLHRAGRRLLGVARSAGSADSAADG